MTRPTPRAMALALGGLPVAAAPVLFGDDWALVWLLAVGALATALALELALLPGSRRVAAQVDVPGAVHLTQPAAVRIRVVAAFTARVEAELEVTGDLDPVPPLEFSCRPGLPEELEAPLRPRRRGLLRVHALHLRWRGLLGLLWREHRAACAHELQVLPDLLTTRRQALRIASSREFQLGQRVERYIGDGSEFEALRDFVSGMDRRAVDWKASARHRALLCREFRAERNHQVMLCIDCGRLMGEPLDGIPRLDHAIHAALQLGQVCLRTGDRVGMFAFAEHRRATVAPAAGLAAMQAIQQQLTAIDYTAEETNYTRSFTELLRGLRRRTLVVLFTDFVDSIAAELMLPSVQRLARRHLVLLVVLRDPLLPRLADARPDSPEALHRSAVAAEMTHDRDLVLERVRRSGGQVIDAPSRRVAVELIDRYLQIKRRELV
ncbi:MAG: DUF58 domain-containing protein [Planctomycetota bacterium]